MIFKIWLSTCMIFIATSNAQRLPLTYDKEFENWDMINPWPNPWPPRPVGPIAEELSERYRTKAAMMPEGSWGSMVVVSTKTVDSIVSGDLDADCNEGKAGKLYCNVEKVENILVTSRGINPRVGKITIVAERVGRQWSMKKIM
jgi:hypothetical protein